MSISQAQWNAIWNNGYSDGWNHRYHQDHPVPGAPSNGELNISRADWDAVWNAGFQKAYGVTVSAPGPTDIPNLGASVASVGGGILEGIGNLFGGGGGNSGAGVHPIGAGDLAYLIPGLNWAGQMDNIAQAVFDRGGDARANSRRTRNYVTHHHHITTQ